MKDIGDYLLEKYGTRLGTADLAEELHTSPEQIRNRISDDTLGIPTYKEGKGQRAPRYADVRDVVDYLNKIRPASPPASPDQDVYSASKIASRNGRTLRRPRVAGTAQNQTSEKSPRA
jgi:hypothetical protein